MSICAVAAHTPWLLYLQPHHMATRHTLNARVPYRSPQTSPMHPCVCVCVCFSAVLDPNRRSVCVGGRGGCRLSVKQKKNSRRPPVHSNLSRVPAGE